MGTARCRTLWAHTYVRVRRGDADAEQPQVMHARHAALRAALHKAASFDDMIALHDQQ
jgi:hypothetical protein